MCHLLPCSSTQIAWSSRRYFHVLAWFAIAVFFGGAGMGTATAQVIEPGLRIGTAPLVTNSTRAVGAISIADELSDGPAVGEIATGELTGRSRWVRFRAPLKGRVAISYPPMPTEAATLNFAAFDRADASSGGDAGVAGFQRVAVGRPCFGSTNRARAVLSFVVQPEHEYLVGVDSLKSAFATNGLVPNPPVAISFQFDLTYAAAPVNDNRENALVIVGISNWITADLQGATPQADDAALATGSAGASVWYTWTAPTNGWLQVGPSAPVQYSPLRIMTNAPVSLDRQRFLAAMDLIYDDYWLPPGYAGNGSGSYGSYGSTVSIHRSTGGVVLFGCPEFAPLFGITADASATVPTWLAQGTELALTVEAGVTYQLLVDSVPGTLGVARFAVEFVPRPANDDFENRIVVSGSSFTAEGHTAGATLAPGEALAPYPLTNAPVVWWSWIAPGEGPVSLAMTALANNPRVSVWRGNSLESLQRVVEPPPNAFGGYVQFYAEAGARYELAVATFDTPEVSHSLAPKPGSYQLDLNQLPARLRPVSAGAGGLLVADTLPGAVMVQQVRNGHWYPAAVLDAAPLSATPTLTPRGIYIPWPTATDPLASGEFRVWILEIPVAPWPVLNLLSNPNLGGFDLHIGSVAGEIVELEKTTGMGDWAKLRTWIPNIEGDSLHLTNALSPDCYFRARPIRSKVQSF